MTKFFTCEGKDELFTETSDEFECGIIVHSDSLIIRLKNTTHRQINHYIDYRYDIEKAIELKPVTITHDRYTFRGYNHEMASISTEIINDLNSESFDHSKICHLLRILIYRLKQLDEIKQEYVNVVHSL